MTISYKILIIRTSMSPDQRSKDQWKTGTENVCLSYITTTDPGASGIPTIPAHNQLESTNPFNI